MKRSSDSFLLLVLFVFSSALAAAPETHKILFIRAGKLIVDAEKPPIDGAEIIVTDGKITAVGKNLEVPAGAEQLDYSHYTVLPGLVDAHTHLWTGAAHRISFRPARRSARFEGGELRAQFRRRSHAHPRQQRLY